MTIKTKKPNLPAIATRLFLIRCTSEEVFVNGRPGKSYYSLLNFFKKEDSVILNNLIIYLNSLEGRTPMTVSDLYLNAERFRQDKAFEKDKAINAAAVSQTSIAYAVDKFIML